jgi:hypothetical protein
MTHVRFLLKAATVRIGFFIGELFGLLCCSCDIGNAFLFEKKEKSI